MRATQVLPPRQRVQQPASLGDSRVISPPSAGYVGGVMSRRIRALLVSARRGAGPTGLADRIPAASQYGRAIDSKRSTNTDDIGLVLCLCRAVDGAAHAPGSVAGIALQDQHTIGIRNARTVVV